MQCQKRQEACKELPLLLSIFTVKDIAAQKWQIGASPFWVQCLAPLGVILH